MRIIVPVDGSAPAVRAVGQALTLARNPPGGELILVNVQNQETLEVSDVSAVISAEADRQAAARQSQDALRDAVGLCRKANVKFATRAELGPVAETVARLARELRADQIVMGTRGLGALRGLVLGSVATNVIRLADIPVTLIK